MKKKRPNFFLHLHTPKIPKRESSFFYTFGLGGISLFLILIIGITGIFEAFYYIPSEAEANSSLQVITHLIPYGSLIRGLHFWAAQLLVGTTILHMLRVVLTGSYKPPRRFNWLLGVCILLLVLFLNFTGYGLRWDEDISWALLVGTNLLKAIPLIGEGLYSIIVGGSSLGGQTIIRFYGWHTFGLAIIAIFFIVWHIFRIRRDGGISSKKIVKPNKKIKREDLVKKEIIAILLVSILLILLAQFAPPGLQSAADFNNIPEEAKAPWFFVWIQQLLRSGNALLMGVIIPIVLLTLIVLIPYLLDRSSTGVGTWFNKEGRIAQIIIILIILGMAGLTIFVTLSNYGK